MVNWLPGCFPLGDSFAHFHFRFLFSFPLIAREFSSASPQTEEKLPVRVVKELFRSRRQACAHGTYDHDKRTCCLCGVGECQWLYDMWISLDETRNMPNISWNKTKRMQQKYALTISAFIVLCYIVCWCGYHQLPQTNHNIPLCLWLICAPAAGLKVKSHCSVHPNDGECESCGPGTYSSDFNEEMSCQLCRSCAHPNGTDTTRHHSFFKFHNMHNKTLLTIFKG